MGAILNAIAAAVGDEVFRRAPVNADMILTADTSNANNPKMTPQLNVSTHAGTGTLQWRILGVSETLANKDFSGSYVKLLVTVNVTQQAPVQTTGI